ncbi:MAG: DUF1153 domain-containing protein [Verrucomicrobiaceae bacterium]|nr:DUF1153 domain-containing protein [Verrucomicrobiaceae bacterium]
MPKAAITPPAVEIETDADSPQRWTAKRKAALVIDILRCKTTAAEAARQHALTLAEVEQWKEDFITQGTEALRSHPRDLAQQFEAREKTLLAKVGELTLHVDVLKSSSLLGQGLAGRDPVVAMQTNFSNRDPRRCL